MNFFEEEGNVNATDQQVIVSASAYPSLFPSFHGEAALSPVHVLVVGLSCLLQVDHDHDHGQYLVLVYLPSSLVRAQ